MSQSSPSSAKSNHSYKRFDYFGPRTIRSPKVYPMSRIIEGLSSRESSASISTGRNTFKYMIMMRSKDNIKNESIFKITDGTYGGRITSIEQLVSRIIYESLKTGGTKFLPMKVALVLDNELIDNQQEPISSLSSLSSAVLYILLIPLRQIDAEANGTYVQLCFRNHFSFCLSDS